MESYLIFWALCAVVCFAIAPMKGRDSFPWALGGLLFGPLAILAILVSPKSPEKETALAIDKGELTLCPYCREAVKPDAIKCKHCQSALKGNGMAELDEREAHSQLQEAIYAGDAERIKAILASGLDLSKNPLAFSHVEYANLHGSQEIIDLVENH
ncbi:MAG: hypothetical protein HLX50_07560 [Alteromonadaceae bacterium]|nr:hypothetical protein [Alteromonadaceae bacterium]